MQIKMNGNEKSIKEIAHYVYHKYMPNTMDVQWCKKEMNEDEKTIKEIGHYVDKHIGCRWQFCNNGMRQNMKK